MVITGYCVENTLARQAMNEPSDFQAMDGRKVPLKMSVDYISFSAHVDFTQNSKFIDDVKAPHVVCIFCHFIELKISRGKLKHF